MIPTNGTRSISSSGKRLHPVNRPGRHHGQTGRPGWHIECSAMSTRYLGPTFAIHGGGGDLLFPHHECEIAQSENATGVKPFSSHWVHVGMVEYEGEKMSKSLGNLVLVSDLLENYSADAVRLYCFSHHYRSPWEFVDSEMEYWQAEADKLVEAVTLPAFGRDELVDVSALAATIPERNRRGP